MKIVIATPFYPPQSGVLGMYAAGLEKAFTAKGHSVAVIVFPKRGIPLLKHLLYYFKLRSAARNAGFVLALDTWSTGVPSHLAARAKGIPCLLRVGGDFLWETYIERTKAQMTLSEFHASRQKLSLKERLIRAGTRHLIHNARIFFTTRFQRSLWQTTYGTPADAPVIENYYPPRIETYLPSRGPVFVSSGREIALKNTLLLQRVFARLAHDHAGLELDTRYLTGEAYGQRLASSYAVVIPSLSEISSNTAIDAVCLGKPFICPEDTGTSERLRDCGLFIDTRSEAALTQAVESLLETPTYERYASAARSFSYTHSWDEIADEVLALI